MIVLLIILILILLFYILYISSKETKETFRNTPSATSSATPSATSSATSSAKDEYIEFHLNNSFSGPIAKIFNIPKTSKGFYRKSNIQCYDDSDCDIGNLCKLNTNNEKYCNKIIDKEAFNLNKDSKGHIIIPNVNTNNINLNFIIMITEEKDKDIEIPIISTSNDSWSLNIKSIGNANNNYIFEIESKFNQNKKTFNNILANKDKIYEIILNTNNNILTVSIKDEDNTNELKNIEIGRKECYDYNICSNGDDYGYCNRERNTNRYCVYSTIDLYLGTNTSKDNYFNGYIGDIFLNSINSAPINNCTFSKANSDSEYSKRSLCEETCKKNNNCKELECQQKCSDVPICEFTPSGRHSEDCITKCHENNDCDNSHCIEQCRNCGDKCPWNDSDIDNTLNQDEFSYDTLGRPAAPRISIINTSSDGTNISLKWKQSKQNLNSNKNTTGYILYLYKTFNKSDGVIIKNIKNKEPTCKKYCNYILNDLDPQETYTVGIKGYNENGLGEMSNLKTFKTDRKIINQDFTIIPDIDESIIGNYDYCHESSENTKETFPTTTVS